MTTKIMLDKAGRVKIPKPTRTKALLKKERGVWVYLGKPNDTSLTVVIDNARRIRMRALNRSR